VREHVPFGDLAAVTGDEELTRRRGAAPQPAGDDARRVHGGGCGAQRITGRWREHRQLRRDRRPRRVGVAAV